MDVENYHSKPLRQLIVILLLSGIGMTFATIYDESFSAWLRSHNSELLKYYLAPSIFELERVGASDLTIFVMITCLIGYVVASAHELKQWPKLYTQTAQRKFLYPPFFNSVTTMRRLRPQLGFILVNALCSALLAVHTIKWLMARPRPKQVLRGDYPFTEWYEVGGQFIGNGIYRGSFPSGHTAAIIALLGVAYCLVYCGKTRRARAIGYFFFLYTWCGSVLMATHRVMSGAHWFSDVVFTIFCGWIITHALFYWGFRVPQRVEATTNSEQYAQVKPFSELLLCIYLFLFCFGIVLMSFSIRSVLIPHTPMLFILFPLGIALCYFSYKGARKTGCFNFSQREGDQ